MWSDRARGHKFETQAEKVNQIRDSGRESQSNLGLKCFRDENQARTDLLKLLRPRSKAEKLSRRTPRTRVSTFLNSQQFRLP